MGSTGPDFRCPLCGKEGTADQPNYGYSADWIGYPTGACCNFKEEGGIFVGGTPTAIKADQLSAIFLLNKKDTADPPQRYVLEDSPLALQAVKISLMKIAIFLLPEEDDTDIFQLLSRPRQR
jgi:hypothetical protein